MTHRRNNKSAKTSDAKADPVRTAAKFGIDIDALKDNLRLSVGERLKRHQTALNTIDKLRRAKIV